MTEVRKAIVSDEEVSAQARRKLGAIGDLVVSAKRGSPPRNAAFAKSTGRDLAPIRTSMLDEEFEKLGYSLHAERVGARRKVLAEAYRAGHVAGGRFEPHAAIALAPSAPAIGRA
jgi:hypothetical protein